MFKNLVNSIISARDKNLIALNNKLIRCSRDLNYLYYTYFYLERRSLVGLTKKERILIERMIKNKIDIKSIAKTFSITEEEASYYAANPLKPSVLTDELIKRIHELYEQGEKPKDIAKDIGFSTRTVYNHLMTRDDYKVIHKKRLSPHERELIIKMFDEKCEIEFIAKMFEISIAATYAIIRSVKGKNNKLGKRLTNEEINKIQELMNQGYKNSQIARILDVNESTISRQVKKIKKGS